ncbi:MAG: ribonuclease HI [Chitinophagaceae bacterium]|nr:MAG: ribonuclease HI [Chitinophagaceae bacterium]
MNVFMIKIYTDGSSKGNPGPGGYGVVMLYKDKERIISQGYRKTTNNRMELLAVITGLEAIKTEGWDVTIYSDSKYVIDAVEKKWVFGWAKKGFVKKKNKDLWTRFLKIYAKHNVKFIWVKGHSNNYYNERCDKLAVEAAESDNLLIDTYYESNESV